MEIVAHDKDTSEGNSMNQDPEKNLIEKYLGEDALVLGSAGFLALVLAGFLLFDLSFFRYGEAKAKADEVATLTEFGGEVITRPSHLPLWENVESQHVFHQRDKIFTRPDGRAIIKFKGMDSTIEVGPNSMVVLEMKQKDDFGGLFAGEPEVASVNINGVKANINKGTKLSVEKDASGKAKLAVLEGKAEIATKEGESVDVSANQQIAVSNKEEISAPSLIPLRLRSPAEGFSTRTGSIISFSYSRDNSLTSPTLQVARSPAFLTPTEYRIEKNTLNIKAPNEGEYYWRITAQDPQSQKKVTSSARQFRVSGNKPPRILSPQSGQILSYLENDGEQAEREGVSPVFAWQATGETQYQLQISGRKGFTKLLLDKVFNKERVQPVLMRWGQYQFRVRALRQDGSKSPWSQPNKFRVVREALPDAPEDIRINLTEGKVRVSWAGVRDTDRYLLQLASKNTFAKDTIIKKGIVNNTHVSFPQTSMATHYIRVRAVDSNDRKTPFSKIASAEPSLPRPLLQSPQENIKIMVESGKKKTKFSWKSSGLVDEYRFQLASDADFSTLIEDRKTKKQSISRTNKGDGNVHWRVGAKLKGRGDYQWSQPRGLSYIKPESLGAPLLVKPEEKSNIIVIPKENDAINFAWQMPETASGGEIQLSKQNTFGDNVIKRKVTLESFTTSLPSLGRWYWRVAARFPKVKKPNFSQVRSFRLVKAVVPNEIIIPQEERDKLIVSKKKITPVTVEWLHHKDAKSYQVELSPTKDFAQLENTWESKASKTKFHLPLGQWFWRVKGIGELKSTGPTSEVARILVHPKPEKPSIKLVSSPKQKFGATLPETMVELSGSDGQPYLVQFAQDSQFEDDVTESQSTTDSHTQSFEEGKWFARTRYKDGEDQLSPWSNVITFTNSKVPPPSPPYGLKVKNTMTKKNRPKAHELSWKASTKVNKFEVMLAHDEDFQEVIREATTTKKQISQKARTIKQDTYLAGALCG